MITLVCQPHAATATLWGWVAMDVAHDLQMRADVNPGAPVAVTTLAASIGLNGLHEFFCRHRRGADCGPCARS